VRSITHVATLSLGIKFRQLKDAGSLQPPLIVYSGAWSLFAESRITRV
jgi:hypothetical protein